MNPSRRSALRSQLSYIVLSKSFCNKMVEAVMKAINLSLELMRGIDIAPETFCKDFLTLLYVLKRFRTDRAYSTFVANLHETGIVLWTALP